MQTFNLILFQSSSKVNFLLAFFFCESQNESKFEIGSSKITNLSAYSVLAQTQLIHFKMIPTSPLSSGMPTGSKYMGWWGDMGGPKQKGITSYVVSPMRQSPMRGALSHYIFNGYKRTLAQAPYFLVPLALGYFTLKLAIEDNDLRNSKKGHMMVAVISTRANVYFNFTGKFP